MKKSIKFIFVLVILLILLGLSLYFYFRRSFDFIETKPKNNISQIEDWSLYKEINKENLEYDVFGDPNECAQAEGFNQEFADFKKQANQGSIKQFLYNGVFALTITPNYNNWTNDQFLAFGPDGGAICSAGNLGPVHAYPDKLLWDLGCGGAMMNAGSIKCAETEQAVSGYFN